MTVTHTRSLRLLTGALVLGATGACLIPVAQAADVPADAGVTLRPTVDAWYQPNPACQIAILCDAQGNSMIPVSAPNPYPAGTLHVAYAAGKETARSYLVLPTDALPTEVEKAVLTIPLDTSATSGSLVPDTAKVQACLVTGDVTQVSGSTGNVPAVACDPTAVLTYVATPTPHLEGDLTALAAGLRTTNGIALLPDATKVGATDAWHVAFSGKGRTGEGVPAQASLAVTLKGGPVTTPSAAPSASASPGASAAAPLGGGFTAPDTPSGGSGFETAPGLGGVGVSIPESIPATSGDAPEVAAEPTVQLFPGAEPVALPETVTFGYAYPAAWLLPLVFLIGVPAVARALTKDLDEER